jgi:hypothetical protein
MKICVVGMGHFVEASDRSDTIRAVVARWHEEIDARGGDDRSEGVDARIDTLTECAGAVEAILNSAPGVVEPMSDICWCRKNPCECLPEARPGVAVAPPPQENKS